MEQIFESPDDEHLFGLGQFQDGHYNLRGVSRRLTQVNSQIAIPFVYSSKGYGLLWHQYGLTDYNPADNHIMLEKQELSEQGNTRCSWCASRTTTPVIATYRKLSGDAPMLTLWAYGFWQCRERYTSAKHLIETVQEFRNRKLPMDVIVQDWQYWGNRGWGVPQFDEVNYPDPAGFIQELHDLNAHFNISIWSNPDKNSEIGKEYVAKDRFIPGTKWLDYFNPETRKDYWNTLRENMFVHGRVVHSTPMRSTMNCCCAGFNGVFSIQFFACTAT